MSELLTVAVIVPFVLGAAIGWCGNWFYYRLSKRAADKSGAQVLLRFGTLLEAVETAGYVELARDASGLITGGRVIRAVPSSGEAGFQGYAPIVKIGAQSSTLTGSGKVTRDGCSR